MNPYESLLREMSELVLLCLEDRINPDQMAHLESLLQSKPEARQIYFQLLNVHIGMQDADNLVGMNGQQLRTTRVNELLHELSRAEKTLPAEPVELPRPPAINDLSRDRIQLYRFGRRDLSRLLVGLAAIIVMAATIIYFDRTLFNVPQQRPVVARIQETMNTVWPDGVHELRQGDPVKPGVLDFDDGAIRILFNDGASAIVQGPARFSCRTEDEIYLYRGNVFVSVPPSSVGFKVRSDRFRVVDLGTEFGVQIKPDGSNRIQMYRGKASLIAGHSEHDILRGGQARKVDGQTGAIASEIYEPEAFIQHIDSKRGIVWKGQPLDLADIVGGGDGWGTGQYSMGIDLETGKKRLDLSADKTMRPSKRFILTPDFPGIDCIFIPGFDDQPAQISSTGLTCDVFPTTNGRVWGYLFNGAWHKGTGVPYHTHKLDGVDLDYDQYHALKIHSNLGISYDLKSIQLAMPGLRPVRLRARAGLSETAAYYTNKMPSAVFWVLLDGEVRLRRAVLMSDGGFDIDIPLLPTTRFVSLAVTDGGDGNAYDWAVFINPNLELEYCQ